MHAELPVQALERHPEMHLALAPQYHLVGFLIVIEPQRRVLLHQLGDGAGELHLVLAVGDRDGKAIDAGSDGTERTSWRRLALRRRHRLAGLNILEPAQRHGFAGTGDRDLARFLTHQMEHPGDPAHPGRGRHAGSIRPTARRQAALTSDSLPPCGGVEGLQHLRDGFPLALETEAPAGRLDARRLVAQRLQQAQNAVAVLRRPEQHRGDQALGDLARQIGEHPIARRLHVVEQLLHQLVVIIGEASRAWRSALPSRAPSCPSGSR